MTTDDQDRPNKIPADVARPDGSLHSTEWFIHWRAGDKCVRLDGNFTATELHDIAFWMENHEPEGTES